MLEPMAPRLDWGNRPRAQDKSRISRVNTAQKHTTSTSVPNRASKTKRERRRQLRIQRKETKPNHNRMSKATIHCPPDTARVIKVPLKRMHPTRPKTAAIAEYRFAFEFVSDKSAIDSFADS